MHVQCPSGYFYVAITLLTNLLSYLIGLVSSENPEKVGIATAVYVLQNRPRSLLSLSSFNCYSSERPFYDYDTHSVKSIGFLVVSSLSLSLALCDQPLESRVAVEKLRILSRPKGHHRK